MSAGIDLKEDEEMAVIAPCSLIGVRVGVAVQMLWEMFVDAVKVVDVTVRVVQEVGVLLVYL